MMLQDEVLVYLDVSNQFHTDISNLAWITKLS